MIQQYLQQAKNISKISLKDLQKQAWMRKKSIESKIEASNNRTSQILHQNHADLSVTSPYYFRKEKCTKQACKCPFHGPRLKLVPHIHKRVKTQGQTFDQFTISPKNFLKDLSNVKNNQSKGCQCQKSQEKQLSKIESTDFHRKKYLSNFKKQYTGKIQKQIKTQKLANLDRYNQKYERFLEDNILVILEDAKSTNFETILQEKASYLKQKKVSKNISFSSNSFQVKCNTLKTVNNKPKTANKKLPKVYNHNKAKRGYQRARTQQSWATNSEYQPNNNLLHQDYIIHQASLLLSTILSNECQLIDKDALDQLLELSNQQYQAVIKWIVTQIGSRKQNNCLNQDQVEGIIDKKLRVIQTRIKIQNDQKEKMKLVILKNLIGELKKFIQGTGQQIKPESIKSRHANRKLTKKSSILMFGAEAAQDVHQKTRILNSFDTNVIQQLEQDTKKQMEESIVFPKTGSVTLVEDNNSYLSKGKNSQKPDRQQYACNRFNRKFITDKSHSKNSTIRRKGIFNVKKSILMMLRHQHQTKDSQEISEVPSESEDLGKQSRTRPNYRIRPSKDKKIVWSRIATEGNIQDKTDQRDRWKVAKPHTTIYMELDKCKTALHYFRHLVKRVQLQLQKYDLGEVIISTEKDSILTKKRKIRVIRKVMSSLPTSETIEDFSKYIQIYEIFCHNCVKAIQNSKSHLRSLLRRPDEDWNTEHFRSLAWQKDLKFMRLQHTHQKILKDQLQLCLEMKTQSVNSIKRTHTISSKNIQQVQTQNRTFADLLQRHLRRQPENNSNELCQTGLSNYSILQNISHPTTRPLGGGNYTKDSEEKATFRRLHTEVSDVKPIKPFREVNALKSMSAHRLCDKFSHMQTILKRYGTKTHLIRNEEEVKKIFHYLLTRYPSCGQTLNSLSSPELSQFSVQNTRLVD